MVDSPARNDTQGVSMTDSPVALITGGGSGIGAAVARRLLDEGQRVAVTGRSARDAPHQQTAPARSTASGIDISSVHASRRRSSARWSSEPAVTIT